MHSSTRFPRSIWRVHSPALVLLALCYTHGADAQDKPKPAITKCGTAVADTAGWKQVSSAIAPVDMMVPPDFVQGPVADDSSTGVAARRQTWMGRTSPHFVGMSRPRDPGAAATHAADLGPKPREVTVCADSIGGLGVLVETDLLRVASLEGGTDSLTFYSMVARIALGVNDTLRLEGMTQTPSDRQRLFTILHSVRLHRDAGAPK